MIPAAADADGSTMLAAAVHSWEPEVVKWLLRRGAHDDAELRKAVQWSSMQSHTAVCVAVLRHVAAARPRDWKVAFHLGRQTAVGVS